MIQVVDPFFNLEEAEALLEEHYRPSLKDGRFELDLGRVEWLSPLTACLLFSWLWELRQAKRDVSLVPPQGDTFAARYLSTTGFLSAVQSLVSLAQDPRAATSLRRLAAFEAFPTEATYKQHLQSLADERQQPLLLHFEQPPELVASGHFHSVVLKELLENSYVHGRGMNTHYAALDTGAAPTSRGQHPIYSHFSGEGYLEVCVADSCDQNLVQKLRPHMPDDFTPDGWIDSRTGALDERERTLIWSLEYGSTSDPDRRRAVIAELAGPAGSEGETAERVSRPEEVATGLHTLARLARAYSGQVVIRAGGRLGTVDYSGDKARHDRPRIAFWRQRRKRRLAPLRGTIVLFRVPKAGYSPLVRSTPGAPGMSPTRKVEPAYVLCGAHSAASGAPPGTVVAGIEDEVVQATRGRERKHGVPRLVCVLLDGLDLDSKPLSVLFQLLSQIPRRGASLLVLSSEAYGVDLASSQWQAAFQTASGPLHLERPPSFVVAHRTSQPTAIYGDPAAAGSTGCTGTELLLDHSGAYVNLGEVIQEARARWLRRALSEVGIRHEREGFLFLIQSSYYVPRFYEIGALAAFPRLRRSLALWLLEEILARPPAVVVCFAEALRPVLNDIVALLDKRRRPEVLQFSRGPTERRILIETVVAAGETGSILLLVDVLSTGKVLTDFLSALPGNGRASIVTVVDARAESLSYVPVHRDRGSEDVPVAAVLVDPVVPLYKRPPDIAAERIVIVDRTTNRPVRYPVPEAGGLSKEAVGDRVAGAGALGAGHFTFHQRHYTYFLALRPLFRHLERELDAWVLTEAEELDKTAGVALSSTRVYCLDEETGLFEIVARALLGRECDGPHPITREELAAPRVGDPAKLAALWFLLPAMDTGKTIRQTLEYAVSLQARHVRVSVVTSRAPLDILAFFQRIRSYETREVRLGLGFSLPLDATSSDDCSGCRRIASLNTILARTANETPHLRRLLQGCIGALRPLDVVDPGSPWTHEPSVDSHGLWMEARLLALYVRGAGGDVRARKELEEHLKDREHTLIFVRGVGRNFEMAVTRTMADVLYGEDPFAAACAEWAEHAPLDVGDIDLYLRGFSVLAPRELRAGLPALFRRSALAGRALDALVIEAMREPTLYFEAVNEVAAWGTDAPPVLYELREFLRSPATQGIGLLENLYAHLVRTSPWGTELTKLKMELRLPACRAADVETLARRFWQYGFKQAQKLWDQAGEESGSVLERLRAAGHDAYAAWRDLEEAATGLLRAGEDLRSQVPENAPLASCVDLADSGIDRVHVAIDAVRARTTRLTGVLSRIALRAHDAMGRIQTLPREGTRYDLEFTFTVSHGCPQLAILEQDFRDVVLWLLENSRRWVASEGKEVRFAFARAGNFVEMRVDDGGPWAPPEQLEGGLKSIRRTCGAYGGRLELPRSPTDTLRVFLPSWETTRGIGETGTGTQDQGAEPRGPKAQWAAADVSP